MCLKAVLKLGWEASLTAQSATALSKRTNAYPALCHREGQTEGERKMGGRKEKGEGKGGERLMSTGNRGRDRREGCLKPFHF